MEQPLIERLLRLMKMLTANNTLSIEDIAERLSTSTRSVYRNIEAFKHAGFVIKKTNSYPKLDTSSRYFKEISELIHFTEEEAYILKSAIESIDENNLLKQNLKKKLYTVYDYNILAETIVSGKNGKNVKLLVDAIENKKSVILHNYSSAHGNDVRNRYVEAFAFTTNYVQVWCYCAEDNTNKLFKVSRIASVEILPDNWQYETEHKAGCIDIFRMNSCELKHIQLKLGLRAAHLLIEEFPLAEKKLNAINDNTFVLNTDVCSFEGVGRFVIGLLDDIEIIDSPEFEDYIKERINKIQNKFVLT